MACCAGVSWKLEKAQRVCMLLLVALRFEAFFGGDVAIPHDANCEAMAKMLRQLPSSVLTKILQGLQSGLMRACLQSSSHVPWCLSAASWACRTSIDTRYAQTRHVFARIACSERQECLGPTGHSPGDFVGKLPARKGCKCCIMCRQPCREGTDRTGFRATLLHFSRR